MIHAADLKLCLSICLLITWVGNSAAQSLQAQKPHARTKVKLPALLSGKPLKEDPSDDEMRKLLKARYNESVAALKEYYELTSLPGVDTIYSLDELYGGWHRLLTAGLALSNRPGEKIALLTQYIDIVKAIEKDQQARYDAGRTHLTDLHRARYERLDAEIQLLQAKRQAKEEK